jgi:hypothetical protein
MQLENSDSFKFRSKIFNQNENDHTMRSKIASLWERNNVRILIYKTKDLI